MAEDVVTLDSLWPTSPAAADNGVEQTSQPGAHQTSTDPVVPAATSALEAKIAEMEARTVRYQQQMEGSRQEALRRASEVDTLRGQLAALEQRLQQQTPSPGAGPAAPPPVSLAEAAQRLVMDNDPSLMHAYEQQLRQHQAGLTRKDVEEVIQASQQRQQMEQHQAALTTQLQTAITQRHPELLQLDQHPQFIEATVTRYQELLNDPVTRLTLPPTPAAMFREPLTGVEYDMRVLLQAADYVKAKHPPAAPPPPVPSLGVTGERQGTAPKGPGIPRALVEGEHALFRQPELITALKQAGWGATPKEQLQKMMTLLPPETRERWARGQV